MENEQEQPKTIEWYEAQVKELKDIRKAYYELCYLQDFYDKGDAYFPDLVKKEFQELKELKEKAKRKSPKNYYKSWGF